MNDLQNYKYPEFNEDFEGMIPDGESGGGSALPEVTASDNGKVLSVVSGEWNKADAPKELPSVTASDNGDVLTVVNGEWGKATPSAGGGGVFLVTQIYNNDRYELDKTYNEIVAAADTHLIMLKVPGQTSASATEATYYYLVEHFRTKVSFINSYSVRFFGLEGFGAGESVGWTMLTYASAVAGGDGTLVKEG